MPATSRVIWNDRAFGARLRLFLRARMQRAGNIVANDTRERVSVPYPPASRPGEPPRKRKGILERSIDSQVTATFTTITVTVRAQAPHASYLDPGGGRIARRPFIGLQQDLAKMVRIVTRG